MAEGQMVLPMERRNGASPPGGATVLDDRRRAPELAPTAVSVGPAAPGQQLVDVDVDRRVRAVTTLAVELVAVVAAVASYEHMRALASVAGEDWRAWLLPVSVDGLAVAASMTMLVRRRAAQRAGALPWAALLLGLGASLAANVAAAEPTVVGRLVAAWPPVGLLLSYELLLQQHSGRPGVQTVRPGAVQPLERTER
jgi:Protein of unknown function (DUF2637)